MPAKPSTRSDLASALTEIQSRSIPGGDGRSGDGHSPTRSNGDSAPGASRDGDVFCDRQGEQRILRGAAIYSGAPRLAELAARLGFETVWIEMEHGPTDLPLAEHICMAAEASGAVPTVRVPDGQRHHVLRALEIGARIVVVPMVQTAEQARQIVEFGKFPPIGARGYNMRSRGVNYGLGEKVVIFAEANARTHLFAQVETMQSVENLDAICAVEGLSGVFVGPGDLSVSAGVMGDLDGDRMVAIVTDCIRRARAAGRHAGILVPPGRMLNAAIDAGCDLVFCCGDVSDLSVSWKRLLASVPSKVAGQ
jgi:2-keto-3-deoxy-L-rhamnonate aldolase RhmA